MRDGGLDQGDGDRARPPGHPRQYGGPDFHRDAADPALPRSAGVQGLGAVPDQARPGWPGAGPYGFDRLPPPPPLRPDDRRGVADRWRLDRRIGMPAGMAEGAWRPEP